MAPSARSDRIRAKRLTLVAFVGYVLTVAGVQYVSAPSLDVAISVVVVVITVSVGYAVGRWWVILFASLWLLVPFFPASGPRDSQQATLGLLALAAALYVPLAALLLGVGAAGRGMVSRRHGRHSPQPG